MKNFNQDKRGDFAPRNDRAGGGFKKPFSGDRGRDFDRKPRSFGGGGGRPSFGGGRPQMHKAVCSECGKDCELPFNPTGDKPVFCSFCFGSRQEKGLNDRPNRFERSDRGERRPSFSSDNKEGSSNKQDIKNLEEKIDNLSSKLEALTGVLEDYLKDGQKTEKLKQEKAIEVKQVEVKKVEAKKPEAKVVKAKAKEVAPKKVAEKAKKKIVKKK